MVGVVIGAGNESIHAINCAKENGVYVIALDGNREAEGLKVADKAVVIDIKDKELVCNYLLEVRPNLTVPVPIGRYLTTTGYVNDYFNLKGISSKATELCTDKYLFHKKLNDRGLRQINVNLITNDDDFSNREFNYPAIIKPRFGSGSRGVALINNKQELLKHLGAMGRLEEDFIVEDAVPGIEYGVDGVVVDGKMQIVLVRKKIITLPPARQCVGYFSVGFSLCNKTLFQNVKKFLQSVVRELCMDNCIFHADLIINEKNIFIIEISGRPSGHYLHNVFTPYVTGIDMISEYIKYIKNGAGDFKPGEVKTAAIHYFDFENCIVEYVPLLNELREDFGCNIVDYQCNLKVGDLLKTVDTGHSVMGRGYFIVEGTNEESLIYQINKILSKFKLRY